MSSPASPDGLEPDSKRVRVETQNSQVSPTSQRDSLLQEVLHDVSTPSLPRPVVPDLTPSPPGSRSLISTPRRQVSPVGPGLAGHGAVEESVGHGVQRSSALVSCMGGIRNISRPAVGESILSHYVSFCLIIVNGILFIYMR